MIDQQLKLKIGQLIIAGFPSPYVDDQARRLIDDFAVGNFALFGRNIESPKQVTRMCRELSQLTYEKTGFAPIFGADQEGGVVTRISLGVTLTPGTMTMAASPYADPYKVTRNAAEVLTAMGLNCTFAPVLDVNMEPMNPIIGSRAFSDKPEVVTDLGVKEALGFQDGGVIPSVKHFPGHGNVKTDSHLSVPVNDTDPAILEETEWKPFREAFRNGCEALMTCHVVYSKVDDCPSTISKKIMTGLLRESMGFKGIALTDCMEMDAIRAAYGIGEGAVRALEAGCDLLTFSHTYEAVKEAVEAIYAAIESGRLSMDRVNESYDRIMAMKKKYGLMTPPELSEKKAQELAFRPECIALNQKISKGSMTLVYDKGGLAALRGAKKPAFFAPASLALTGAEDEKKYPTEFSRLAAERFGGTYHITPMNEVDEETVKAIEDDSYDVAVLGLYNARFRKGQQELLRRMEALNKPLIVIMLGAPYDAMLVERADALIAAYEYTELAARMLLEAMDEGVYEGKLPVELPTK